MKVVQSSYSILTNLSEPINILKNIEYIGRTCYKSTDKITDDSCLKFCKMLIDRGHEAMIEHSQLTVKFTIDRAIANELVRHRLCSFAQESSRYCNYSKEKFSNEIKVISPEDLVFDSDEYNIWYETCKQCEESYMSLIKSGIKPELARNVLPLSLATELVVTANIREWRNIFKLRVSEFAHPQMRVIMRNLLNDLQCKIPVLFDDIHFNENNA